MATGNARLAEKAERSIESSFRAPAATRPARLRGCRDTTGHKPQKRREGTRGSRSAGSRTGVRPTGSFPPGVGLACGAIISPRRGAAPFFQTAHCRLTIIAYLCRQNQGFMADNSILSRLDGLKLKYEETGQKLTDPEVIADVKQFVQLNKEYKELEPIIETSERYRTALANLAEAKDILSNDKDEEMREMARGEITELEPAIEQMEEQIKLLLIPKDPQDSKNAIMEIRGGTGGDEAAIFAGDLLRMYTKYIESKGWRYEMTSFSDGAAGGYKEVVLKVTGQNVYGTLKYESGVHRVQRVPATETQGRVHTSTATVLVMPEMEEVDVQINKSDLRIDTYRASGAGGQHINKTDSAVRITHLPTGIVATSQDGRSQHDNRDKAMKALVARVYDYFQSQQTEAIDSERKSKVGTGDRAEKIRTYNYPQNRVTDHRIGLTIQQLDRIIEGKLDDIITALINEDQRLKLEGQK